jgi:nucleoside-diphosphate-sugar epimerase
VTSGGLLVDFIYVVDVVRGYLKAAITEGLEGKQVDLGPQEPYRVRRVVEMIDEMIDSETHPQYGAIPDRIDERPHIADLDACQELMDWEPLWSLEEGLEETLAWYRSRVGEPVAAS